MENESQTATTHWAVQGVTHTPASHLNWPVWQFTQEVANRIVSSYRGNAASICSSVNSLSDLHDSSRRHCICVSQIIPHHNSLQVKSAKTPQCPFVTWPRPSCSPISPLERYHSSSLIRLVIMKACHSSKHRPENQWKVNGTYWANVCVKFDEKRKRLTATRESLSSK